MDLGDDDAPGLTVALPGQRGAVGGGGRFSEGLERRNCLPFALVRALKID